MITLKKESITDATELVIAHGCNRQGKMGKGAALAIRQKWPEAFMAYEREVLHGIGLGHVVWARASVNTSLFDGPGPLEPWIANIITQERYGNDGFRYTSYDAVDVGLRSVARRSVSEFETNKIAVTRIGAGYGGGHWSVITSIMEEVSRDFEVEWTVYDPNLT